MRASSGKLLQLVLVPILLQVYMSPSLQASDCPRGSSHESLICVNDFDNNITCVWNSTYGHAACNLYASKKQNPGRPQTSRERDFLNGFRRNPNASCDLEPFDSFRPALRRCSLVFNITWVFQPSIDQQINLTCKSLNYSLSLTYKPKCHVKLKPPGGPHVNLTTITWSVGASVLSRIHKYSFSLQWKPEAQSWKDAFVRNKTKDRCDPVCQIELDADLLEQGRRYEARIRVQSGEDWSRSVWSEWSPTATWVSAVGRVKAPDGILKWDALTGSIVGAVIILSFTVVLCKRDERIWVCMLRKFTGPPLPDPGKFLLHDGNFQAWLTPQFINDSYFLRPVDICSVEVTGTIECLVAQDSEAAPSGRRKADSGSSSSDPVRLPLCPPPLSFCTEGNLKPCVADSPYKPAGDESNGAMDQEEGQDAGVEDVKWLSCIGMRGGPVQESRGTDRVEKIQWCELQSNKLGMGSSETEQVSEEIVDRTNLSCDHSEQSQEEGREMEDGKETETSQLFGGISSQGSIQICSDYERIEKVRAPCPELQSAGSSTSGQCEEQVSQERQEGGDSDARSTADSLCPFSSRLSNLTWPETDSQPGPLKGHLSERVSRILLTSSIEPSGGGYMPVGEAQN